MTCVRKLCKSQGTERRKQNKHSYGRDVLTLEMCPRGIIEQSADTCLKSEILFVSVRDTHSCAQVMEEDKEEEEKREG